MAANIPAGGSPFGITYDSTDEHIYVSNLGLNTVIMVHPGLCMHMVIHTLSSSNYSPSFFVISQLRNSLVV